jgi:peptide/nickel transport system permease protein
LSTIPVLLLVSAAIFSMLHLVPGDPVSILLGDYATAEAKEALRAELGLDQPLVLQYVRWLWDVLQGDFGRSFRTNQPVLEAITERLPVTIELSILALLVAVIIGLPAGILAAVRRNSPLDVASTSLALLGISVPNFFLGILLIFIFSLWLRWLPPGGYVSFSEAPLENLRLMLMPAFTLGTAFAGIVARMTRASLLEVLSADYVRTARSKGLSAYWVILKHALKNSLLPVVTVVGLQAGALLGGAILTETVFSLPGIGRLVVDNIFARDFPVVQGVILIIVLFRMLSNLVTDLVYALLDPRISYS